MPTRNILVASLLALVQGVAWASPGDVFVPAHRTRDGSYVPPNVAPMSGGSHLAKRPTRRMADTGWRRGEAPRLMHVKPLGSRPAR